MSLYLRSRVSISRSIWKRREHPLWARVEIFTFEFMRPARKTMVKTTGRLLSLQGSRLPPSRQVIHRLLRKRRTRWMERWVERRRVPCSRHWKSWVLLGIEKKRARAVRVWARVIIKFSKTKHEKVAGMKDRSILSRSIASVSSGSLMSAEVRYRALIRAQR